MLTRGWLPQLAIMKDVWVTPNNGPRSTYGDVGQVYLKYELATNKPSNYVRAIITTRIENLMSDIHLLKFKGLWVTPSILPTQAIF